MFPKIQLPLVRTQRSERYDCSAHLLRVTLESGPNFTNERVQYLNADHLELVKFQTPHDDGYLKLKKSLGSAIEDVLKQSE